MSEMEVKRFGCSTKELEEAMKNFKAGKTMFALSIMIESQTVLMSGDTKQANKLINRAIWVLMRLEED